MQLKLKGYEYKFKRTKEPKENWDIEKFGLCAKFNLRLLFKEILDGEKQLKELKSKTGIQEATMNNVLRNYPIVGKIMDKLSKKDFFAFSMYFREKEKYEADSLLLKQTEKILKQLKNEYSLLKNIK
ncbi:MAG TPA: hypothetical protein PK698_06400 [Bacilli bacterium]|nr:hypothetical protein [Bacilli bacterium]